MGAEKRPRSPVASAFLETATAIDTEWPGMETAKLEHVTILALLRRLMFQALFGWDFFPARLKDPADPETLDAWWTFCREAGCPLLDEDLDGSEKTGVDPLRSSQVAWPASRHPDLGEWYQALREVSLSRIKKGRLSLGRGRLARRRSGLFFTPDWMASRLSALLLDPWLGPDPAGRLEEPVRLLDPACGSGRLLVACLDRMLSAAGFGGIRRAEAARRLIPSMLRGVDLDPLSVGLSRTLLWMVADPRRGPVEGLDELVVVGDAIGGPLRGGAKTAGNVRWEKVFPRASGEGTAGFDFVIANPPFEVLKGYAKRQGLKSYVGRIRKSGYDLALSGNLNTYRLFLERALQLLAPGGRLAFVLPLGFLTDRTAAPLRAHMVRSGWIRHVEVYPESARAFEGVGQSVVLLSAVKNDKPCERLVVRDGTRRVRDCLVQLDQLVALDADSLPIPVTTPDAFGLVAKLQSANRSSLGDLATGRVGEVDQTNFRRYIKSAPAGALLLRGVHVSPYRVNLEIDVPEERWLDGKGFDQARGGGRWKEDIGSRRLVQTGIVNLEAGRRLVAAEVPGGVYLGNSVNYWIPKERPGWEADQLRGYLLGLLNSTPLEWRFRLTSSNNNINLYEVRSLPVPVLTDGFPGERVAEFLDWAVQQVDRSRSSVLGTVREITSGWGSPARDDRATARLIGRIARLRLGEDDERRCAWLDAVLDHFVNWHLGLDEPDLARMLQDVPARACPED